MDRSQPYRIMSRISLSHDGTRRWEPYDLMLLAELLIEKAGKELGEEYKAQLLSDFDCNLAAIASDCAGTKESGEVKKELIEKEEYRECVEVNCPYCGYKTRVYEHTYSYIGHCENCNEDIDIPKEKEHGEESVQQNSSQS